MKKGLWIWLRNHTCTPSSNCRYFFDDCMALDCDIAKLVASGVLKSSTTSEQGQTAVRCKYYTASQEEDKNAVESIGVKPANCPKKKEKGYNV